ncbi:MAG TPA: potassium channel family protein [Candidatus Nanopelagicales bacterium]|jgi:hypothetical protein|nr:potassium channel family protein [Candidatus Nanopelagicales bacterium]
MSPIEDGNPLVPAAAAALWERKSRREQRELLLRSVLGPAVTAVLLVVAYFLLPLEDPQGAAAWLLIIVVLLVFVAVLSWQIRAVVSASFPALRAVQAVAVALPTYLLGFSLCYLWMSDGSPVSFSEPLTRMGALYFTVTVFATVGFGDITAATDSARAVVTVQMVVNLVLLAAGLRLLTLAVRRGQARRAHGDGQAGPVGPVAPGPAEDPPPR